MSFEGSERLLPRDKLSKVSSKTPSTINRTSILHLKTYDYPFSQYNLVMECYNHEVNNIDKIQLSKLEESSAYRFVYSFLSKPLGKIILSLSILFLPLINVFFYIALWYAYFTYNSRYQIYLQNRKKVKNPLINMIYSPEVCELMSRNYWFFEIQLADIYGFTFNFEVIEILKHRSSNGVIKFMVYNTTFETFYKQFPKIKKMHRNWVIISTFLMLIFICFVVLLSILGIQGINRDDQIE